MSRYDVEYGVLLNLATIGSWEYETNISSTNSETSQEAWLKVSKEPEPDGVGEGQEMGMGQEQEKGKNKEKGKDMGQEQKSKRKQRR